MDCDGGGNLLRNDRFCLRYGLPAVQNIMSDEAGVGKMGLKLFYTFFVLLVTATWLVGAFIAKYGKDGAKQKYTYRFALRIAVLSLLGIPAALLIAIWS